MGLNFRCFCNPYTEIVPNCEMLLEAIPRKFRAIWYLTVYIHCSWNCGRIDSFSTAWFTLASIPGRVFAFITVRRTIIKAKTRPGIEARFT